MPGMATMRPRRRAVTAVRGHTKTGVHGWPGLTPGHDGRGISGGDTDQLHMQLPCLRGGGELEQSRNFG